VIVKNVLLNFLSIFVGYFLALYTHLIHFIFSINEFIFVCNSAETVLNILEKELGSLNIILNDAEKSKQLLEQQLGENRQRLEVLDELVKDGLEKVLIYLYVYIYIYIYMFKYGYA
jgi:fructose-1-phosphate kinase PfkB-like protein